MDNLQQTIGLFLTQSIGPTDSVSMRGDLQQQIAEFFSADIQSKHLIFKRSILYFYNKDTLINSVACPSDTVDANVYTFDGKKISRITPEYYIGSGNAVFGGVATAAAFWGSSPDIELSANNNNNNNNNNNGNNNG